ncbi:sensor protein EvgS precursor [bacterium BMS3Abin03]|nr:sensor protein EvgS precursor [bacterium BMS3Abin03]
MPEDFSKFEKIILNHLDDDYYWYQNLSENENTIYFSEGVRNVTGYTPEELQSMPGQGEDIVLDEDHKSLKKLVNKFKSDPAKDKLTIEFRIKRKNGKLVWVKEQIFKQKDNDGNLARFYGKVSDISAFKDREVELINRVEELKEINASKDNFISILSHDLRAPFTSILGFSEILLNEPNISDKEKAEYLAYINDSSQNQLQLINYLLDYSRLQTGKLKIDPQRVQAQSTVFNCVSSLTGVAVRKNIDIKVNVRESFFVEADERLLNQVIVNLISNAIKFSPEETTIEISANIFNDKFIEFIVKDEGIGISEENKDKLFKIGKMFSTEGTKGEKGTGLGLTLVKQIVEKHGGELWFYSTPGEGSEFHFTLPSSTNIILIVKSNSKKREELSSMLKKMYSSYEIISVEDGYEALGIILNQMPSLLITDHEMPLMNGIQLVQSIRKENKILSVPVIALLNNDSETLKKTYQEYGIITLLDNPLDPSRLKEKLNESLIN